MRGTVLVSWNVWWRFDDRPERQTHLVEALRRAEPDVVALQETWPEQSERLARELGLEVVSISAAPFPRRVRSSLPADLPFGNSLLSRWPARAPEPLALPGTRDDAHRVAVGAIVDRPTGPLGLVSTHLTHRPHDGDVRRAQLRAIDAWVAERFPGDLPVLVVGDFNCTPTSDEYGEIAELGWTDLWRAQGTGRIATMDRSNPHFRDTAWMDDRNGPSIPDGEGIQLDYVCAVGGRPRPSVRSLGVLGRGPDEPWPSDHLGWRLELD